MIVRGFDAVTDGRFPHLLIEHLEGPTLRELIERDGALAARAGAAARRCTSASALHYMAGEGMVHLDVKPENIVMGAPPRLIDLSVARTVERGAGGCAARSAPTPTWRPSSATRRARRARPARRRVRPRRDAAPRGRRPPAVPAAAATERFPQLDARPEPLPRRVPRRSRSCSAPALAREPATGRPRPSSRPGWSRWSRRCRGGWCWAALGRATRWEGGWLAVWRPRRCPLRWRGRRLGRI